MLVEHLKTGGERSCPPHELHRIPAYRGAGTISLTLFLPAFLAASWATRLNNFL